MQKVMLVLQLSGHAMPVAKVENHTEPASLEARLDSLRKKCNRKAYQLSKLLGVPVKEVHYEYGGGLKHKDMTEAQLRAKLDKLIAGLTSWKS